MVVSGAHSAVCPTSNTSAYSQSTDSYNRVQPSHPSSQQYEGGEVSANPTTNPPCSATPSTAPSSTAPNQEKSIASGCSDAECDRPYANQERSLDANGIPQERRKPPQLRGGRHAFVSPAANSVPAPKAAADDAGDDTDISSALLAQLDVSFALGDSHLSADQAAAPRRRADNDTKEENHTPQVAKRVQQFLALSKPHHAASGHGSSGRDSDAKPQRTHEVGASDLEGCQNASSAAQKRQVSAVGSVVPAPMNSDLEQDRPFMGYGGEYLMGGELPGSCNGDIKSYPVPTSGSSYPAPPTRAEFSPHAQPEVLYSTVDASLAPQCMKPVRTRPREPFHAQSGSDAEYGAAGTSHWRSECICYLLTALG
jgi:hypothetical protein